MGRPKSYSREAVIEKAMRLFWQNGYKATSVSDIVHETGLNTASMYKEFGDKDGLFSEALDHYRHHVIGPRYQILTDNPNLSSVEMFLRNVFLGASKEEYKGCLMMNHLAQKHVISTDAVKQVGAFCAEIESLVENALCNAQSDGDIGPDKDTAQLASFIVFCVHGAVLYGRHHEKKHVIPNFHDAIMRELRG